MAPKRSSRRQKQKLDMCCGTYEQKEVDDGNTVLATRETTQSTPKAKLAKKGASSRASTPGSEAGSARKKRTTVQSKAAEAAMQRQATTPSRKHGSPPPSQYDDSSRDTVLSGQSLPLKKRKGKSHFINTICICM